MKLTVSLEPNESQTQDQHPVSLKVRNLVGKNCENGYFRKLNVHSNAGRTNAKTNSLTSVVCCTDRIGNVMTPCHVHSNASQVCLVFQVSVLPLMCSQFEQCVWTGSWEWKSQCSVMLLCKKNVRKQTKQNRRNPDRKSSGCFLLIVRAFPSTVTRIFIVQFIMFNLFTFLLIQSWTYLCFWRFFIYLFFDMITIEQNLSPICRQLSFC